MGIERWAGKDGGGAVSAGAPLQPPAAEGKGAEEERETRAKSAVHVAPPVRLRRERRARTASISSMDDMAAGRLVSPRPRRRAGKRETEKGGSRGGGEGGRGKREEEERERYPSPN